MRRKIRWKNTSWIIQSKDPDKDILSGPFKVHTLTLSKPTQGGGWGGVLVGVGLYYAGGRIFCGGGLIFCPLERLKTTTESEAIPPTTLTWDPQLWIFQQSTLLGTVAMQSWTHGEDVVKLFWIFQPGCFGFWGSVLCVAQSNVILHKVRIFDRESWKLSTEEDSKDDSSADGNYNDGDDYSDDVDDHLPMTFSVAPALIMWCLL